MISISEHLAYCVRQGISPEELKEVSVAALKDTVDREDLEDLSNAQLQVLLARKWALRNLERI